MACIPGKLIQDNTISEAKLLITNSPSTGYYLKYTAEGMTWAEVSAGTPTAIVDGTTSATAVSNGGSGGYIKFTIDNAEKYRISTNGIYDPNGKLITYLTYAVDAVNYVKISNSATGDYPIIESDGTDTDKGLRLATAGAGAVVVYNVNESSGGSILILEHFTGSPADDDIVGQLRFVENDDEAEATIFGQIGVVAKDVTDESEDGAMYFEVFRAGSSTEYLNFEDGYVNIQTNLNANMNYLDADHSWSGMTMIATVDSNNVGIGGLLTLSTDGHWDTASNTGTATSGPLAIALESGTGSKRIMLLGTMRDDTWDWTLGDGQANLLYLGEQGAITATVPEGTGVQVQVIGYMLSADKIYFNPQLVIAELS